MPVYPNGSIVHESEREYHPYHQYGDVLFVSNQGLYFRTDGRRLANESTVFRDMLQVPQAGVKSNEKAISLDVTSRVLDIFLTHVSPNHFMLATTFEETHVMLSLCDKFDCSERLIDLLKGRLMDQFKTIPWRALVIASNRDDRKLGAKALRSINRDIFLRGEGNDIYYSSNLKDSMNRLRSDWRGKIWDLVLEDNTSNATVTRMVPRKWKSRRRIWHTDYHAEVTKEKVLPFRDDWNDIANRFQQDDW
ncbi:hypothetical protein V865_007178 [Kwoniella europaea PYCC6329]|uniref:BTB domain-containing protein n=1 Tax=Kwoniella europaea PYCC6329 TaxID=1423913 RepID=A0AAX4KS05_9TREE